MMCVCCISIGVKLDTSIFSIFYARFNLSDSGFENTNLIMKSITNYIHQLQELQKKVWLKLWDDSIGKANIEFHFGAKEVGDYTT